MSLFEPAEWIKVPYYGESKGVGTKASLFVCNAESLLCLKCVGVGGLFICCRKRGEEGDETCGTRHNGPSFKSPGNLPMKDLLFVHDPKNKTRFLTTPWAERSWFSNASVRIMATDHKSVPEWSEVFRIAHLQAHGDSILATTDSIQRKSWRLLVRRKTSPRLLVRRIF
jgi:hypothetical protein